MDQREQKLEPRDWTAFGKDSFTTPGAAAPYPAAPGSRVYAYARCFCAARCVFCLSAC